LEVAFDLSSDRLLNDDDDDDEDDDDEILRVKLNRGYRVQNIKSLLIVYLINRLVQINFLPLLHTRSINMCFCKTGC